MRKKHDSQYEEDDDDMKNAFDDDDDADGDVESSRLSRIAMYCWIVFMAVLICLLGEMLARNVISDYITKDTMTTDGKVLYDITSDYNSTVRNVLQYLEDTYDGETFEVCGVNDSYDIQVISSKYPDVKMSVREYQYKKTRKCYYTDNRNQVIQWYLDNLDGIVTYEDGSTYKIIENVQSLHMTTDDK